jgi:Flp pilus assembly pilin Flp
MRPTLVCDLIRDEEGVTAVEYAVMLALIICGVAAAVNAVGNSTADGWRHNVGTITEAINQSGS